MIFNVLLKNVLWFLVWTVFFLIIIVSLSEASDSTIDTYTENSWYQQIDTRWGGHVKARGAVSWHDDRTAYALVDTGPYYDGHIDFRLKNTIFFSDWGSFETHYEAVLAGGDTTKAANDLETLDLFQGSGQVFNRPINDDRRFFNFTSIIEEEDYYTLYHRLDRFVLTVQPQWGVINLGRQAMTWGNGLVFNPMDLFNPFAPTDIERDYKVGDDMAAVQFAAGMIDDVHMLYVPRRDSATGEVETDQSSFASKMHATAGTTEFDVMYARHYQEDVAGIGSRGYLFDAAWRMDVTWSTLDKSHSNSYVAVVANMDYSWAWWQKNMYGFIEFYFNSLGKDQYDMAIIDPDIYKRIERGEMFTLGRKYLSGHIHVELHPLFNAYMTVINNLSDPSGIIQPRVLWDVAENFLLTAGANVSYGATGTEFGGFPIPETNFIAAPPASVFLWGSWYF